MAFKDAGQGVEAPVGPPVAFHQVPGAQVLGVVGGLEAAILGPVVVEDAAFAEELVPDLGAGAGGQDEHEGDRGLDPDEEIHGGVEDVRPVAVQAEHDVH